MRKLDKLIIKSFIGPFLLTTAIATFILLIQYMMKYFDDFVGKDLGFMVFAKLLFYFSLNMLQVALPLGVLVSSLMTFGNLGEHFELTAIKGAGISLVRALRPVFVAVCLISVGAFFFNNYIVPVANLKAYSLLYDIRHKKPTLDITEGAWYHGIPNYVIKVNKKMPDDVTLKDVIIYDHNDAIGNKRVILADSSRMFLFMDDRYLKLELFDGNYYNETRQSGSKIDQFARTRFTRMDMVFSLASFNLDQTDENLFTNNRQMKNIAELNVDIDSMKTQSLEISASFDDRSNRFFNYFNEEFRIAKKLEIQRKRIDSTDLTRDFEKRKRNNELDVPETNIKAKSSELKLVNGENDAKLKRKDRRPNRGRKAKQNMNLDSLAFEDLDSLIMAKKVDKNQIVKSALNQSRNVKNTLNGMISRIDVLEREKDRFEVEKWKKYSQAAACIFMFLIGAPLGAIIKKGGFGFPVVISIFFFIMYYVFLIMGQKFAKENIYEAIYAVWLANAVLLPFGLFFLRQARIDARLFDADVYTMWFRKMRERLSNRGKKNSLIELSKRFVK